MAPGKGNRRIQQLRAARAVRIANIKKKKEESEEEFSVESLPACLLARFGDESEEGAWFEGQLSEEAYSEDSEEEEYELTDNEEQERVPESVFDQLLVNGRDEGAFDGTRFLYQRGPEPSLITIRRRARKQRDDEAAAIGTHAITRFFPPAVPTTPQLPKAEQHHLELCKALADLNRKIHSKTHGLNEQTLSRHRSVLAFLHLQIKRRDDTGRKEMAYEVAKCCGRGQYMARKIIHWEREWMDHRRIPEGNQGCFVKSSSWFNDEGVEAAVREYIASHRMDRK
jgi:hypothetical protein